MCARHALEARKLINAPRSRTLRQKNHYKTMKKCRLLTLSVLKCSHAAVTEMPCCCCCYYRHSSLFQSPINVLPHTRNYSATRFRSASVTAAAADDDDGTK